MTHKAFEYIVCDSSNIHVIVFKATNGTKCRLGIVECFNRTLRQLIERQVRFFHKKNLQVSE